MECTWGKRVQRRLEKLGKTQRQLAAAIYYAPSHLSGAIHGEYNPELQGAVERQLRSWENERYYRSILEDAEKERKKEKERKG